MSRLTNVARIKNRGDVKAKEYGNQTYRSGFDFATQMRVATEKSKTFVNPNLPESELVRPYMSDSYETMEYDIVPDAGLQSMPTADTGPLAIRFDVDWDSPTVANIAFEDAWGDEVAVPSTFIGTFYSGSVYDDGYVQRNGGDYFNALTKSIDFGGDGSPIFNSFFRFKNINIPKNALILEALLQFYTETTRTGSTSNTITCNNTANAVAPTSVAESDALAHTLGFVETTLQGWVSGNWYDYSDIKSEVQQIVDRVDWKSGNALMVLITYYSGLSRRYPIAFGYGNNPQLKITWKV